MGHCRCFFRLAGVVWTVLCLGVATLTSCRSDSDSPPRPTGRIPAIPNPDTSDMQAPVAALIRTARARVTADPSSATAWGRLGAALDAHHLFADAEPAYRRALELDPHDIRYPYNLAVVLETIGEDSGEILALLDRVAAREPEFPPVFFRKGQVLSRQGRLDEAAQAYRRALALDPKLTIAHRSLGQVLLGLDEVEDAVKHLEHASQLAPADGPTLAALSQAYARQGDAQRSGEAAAKARERVDTLALPDPIRFIVTSLARSARLTLERAKQRIESGEIAAAIKDLQIVARSYPNNAHVYEQLGVAYERSGQTQLANQHYATARRLRGER